MVTVRPYQPDHDADGLWACKQAFERGMGDAGSEAKAAAYERKLTEEYRERYLAWVERCTRTEPASVQVAINDKEVVGYVFVLPEDHAMIWDGAVLNEVYVRPQHRGTDVADALLEAALDHARGQSLPLDRILLDVDVENERAQAFYRRHGFEHWGEMVARDL
jgi:ribosomal protein S18 acetylase RimI-like enzyme